MVAHFQLDISQSGEVRGATARVRGRAAAFAAASAICEAARGRSVIEASGIGLLTLHPTFAQLDGEDRERALVVEDAFHHALGAWVVERVRPGGEAESWTSGSIACVVAMSGGVDSAVALHETADVEDGGVVGVTLRLWVDPRAPDPESACCSPASVRRARATCHRAGVGHFGIDLRNDFAAAVVAPFLEQYRNGETPNPCTRCNGRFRLDELVRIADAIGAGIVVTGHYARRIDDGMGRALVARAVDPRKDQSYMLAQLDPATTHRLRFPLGARTKVEVRERAHQLGLEQAGIADSQDVCFLGGGDYRDLLARADSLGPGGRIVTEAGEVIGSHTGIAAFTPGQRRGLGNLAGSTGGPRYVIATDPATGTVVVGGAGSLDTTTVELRDVVSHVSPRPDRADVQLRYRAGGYAIPCRIHWRDDGGASIHLADPARAPAPGQVACMYDDRGAVVAAGTITRADIPGSACAGSGRSRAVLSGVGVEDDKSTL